MLIQRNVNGSNFFNRSWAAFKVGFGDPSGNYWLGNDLLSQLTVNNRYKLKFDLQSRSNTSNWYWAEYGTFIVQTEAYNYMMWASEYSGNTGDYFGFSYMFPAMFSTYDRENDRAYRENCAVYGGGFWYGRQCNLVTVNGFHDNSTSFDWLNLSVSGGSQLQSTRMWLKCKQ